jgi:fungal type III polyketide synthase
VVLTPRVPTLASAAVPPIFDRLVGAIPELAKHGKVKAAEFDWALHPGGSTVISGIEQAMGLTQQHLRASYEVYMNHGNSSSATIFSVLDTLLRAGEGAEHVVACAFGPGIAVEMMLLKRFPSSRSGTQSPNDSLEAEEVD